MILFTAGLAVGITLLFISDYLTKKEIQKKALFLPRTPMHVLGQFYIIVPEKEYHRLVQKQPSKPKWK